MKITKRELKSIIRKNLSKELNEAMYYHTDSKFNFDYCDLGDIEFTKSYKKLMSFRDKANKTNTRIEIGNIESELKELTPAAIAANPANEAKRESLLKRLERAKKAQADGLSSIFDKEFMGYTLGGIKTPSFMNNLSFLVNVGAYASMGPAAALYCKTLKNILTVIDAAADTYTEEYEEKSGLESFSEFDRFYTILDRSIGLKMPGTLSIVLNNYFSKFNIESTATKALFKLFFLKELIQFAHEPQNPTSPSMGGGKGLPLTTPSQKEAASAVFEAVIMAASKSAEFQSLISKLKRKPERNNFTRQIRKKLQLALENSPNKYAEYVKDDNFRMRELERYLADNFIEGDVRRKTASRDDTAIEKVNDFKNLIDDIEKIGGSINGIRS